MIRLFYFWFDHDVNP